jgi:phosphoribosylamine-glycine ligase
VLNVRRALVRRCELTSSWLNGYPGAYQRDEIKVLPSRKVKVLEIFHAGASLDRRIFATGGACSMSRQQGACAGAGSRVRRRADRLAGGFCRKDIGGGRSRAGCKPSS